MTTIDKPQSCTEDCMNAEDFYECIEQCIAQED
jgi:hypothetical protein